MHPLSSTREPSPPLLPSHGLRLEQVMGENIRLARVRRGMSLESLAGAAMLTTGQLRDYESGATRIVTGDLLCLVDALDIGIGEVFAG